MNAEDYFYKLLKPLFPTNANLKVIDLKTSDLDFRVDWRTPTERKANKRSHPIQISISEDILEDYRDDLSNQKQRDVFIMAYIKEKLNAYVDDGIAAPPIEWTITSGNTYAAEPRLKNIKG